MLNRNKYRFVFRCIKISDKTNYSEKHFVILHHNKNNYKA